MKKTFKYMIVALAGLTLLACSKELEKTQEEEIPASELYSYTIEIAGDVKSHLDNDHMAWDSGDNIGWFAQPSGKTFELKGAAEVNMSASPRTFTLISDYQIYSGDYLYVFAPCFGTPSGTRDEVSLYLSTDQYGDDIYDAMPMVAPPVRLSSTTPGYNQPATVGVANFINLGSIIEYNVYTSDNNFAAEEVTSVSFAAATSIAGSFTLDLTTVSESSIPALAGLNESTVNSYLNSPILVGSSKATGVKVYQVVAPGNLSGTLTVTTDKANYQYTLPAADFARNTIKTVNIDLAGGTRSEIVPIPDCPYWYEFADGDFGIGPVFDWGGWDDGYYYDMLTVPYVLNGATWSISAAEYFEWAGTQAESGWRHGIQLCTGGLKLSNFKLTSSSFPGEITSVTLGYNSGITDNSSLSVSCKVGGVAFGSTVYHGDGDYEAVFTGSASGEIEITLDSSVNGAVYLYYIAIEFDPNAVVTPPDPGTETTWDYTVGSGDFGLTTEPTNALALTSSINGKSWTVSTDSGYYCIKQQWAWAGLALWCANGWNNYALILTLESSDFAGTIKSVGIDLSLGGHEHQLVSCTVGGVSFGSQEINNDDEEHAQQTVTFTGSASGKIVITVDNSLTTGIPMMFRGLHVTYTPV